MGELIELFKEYVDNHWTDTKDIEKEYWVIDYWQWFQYWTREYLYEIIVSKKFWFIKWLVKNDKIDRENWGLLDNCMSEFDRYPISFDNKKLNYRAVDMLLMLLSIQDNPIEFLISILK